MVWGQIAGAVIGGVMANKAAKNQSNAMNAATQANMAGFNMSKPFLKYGYNQNKDAYNTALDMGAYQGDTYANMNPMQNTAYDGMYGFGQNQADMGQGLMNTGSQFGQNYQNLYNQAQTDMLGNAMQYATDNQEPLLTAAMRDPYRNLTENTLTGIDQSASATGNANSSRAGVAEAVANRAFDDRMADTATNIQQNLINQSMDAQQNQFSNMMNANQGLYNTLSAGQSMAGAGFGDMANAGRAFQTDSQNQMNADKAQFEDKRDFGLNANTMYMNNLSGAPTSVSGIQPNYNDPMTATMGGMMSGAGFGNKYLQPVFNNFAQPQYSPQQQQNANYGYMNYAMNNN